MTQRTEQTLFGELRSLMAMVDKDQRWGALLLKLLGQARERLGQEHYEQVWAPYLQGAHASLPHPLYIVGSLQELERVCILAPSASFAFKLTNQRINASAIKTMLRSPYLSNLTALELYDLNMGVKGVTAIASSPQLSNLTSFDLDCNDIGDEGAQALADSPYLCESIRQEWRRAQVNI